MSLSHALICTWSAEFLQRASICILLPIVKMMKDPNCARLQVPLYIHSYTHLEALYIHMDECW